MPIYKNNLMIYRSGRYRFDNSSMAYLLEAVRNRFPRADLDQIRQAVPVDRMLTRSRLQKDLAKALNKQGITPSPADLQYILQNLR